MFSRRVLSSATLTSKRKLQLLLTRVQSDYQPFCANESLDQNIVAFASRSLSPVELRYSQTEKEALAIVWGIEHYHLYLFGSKFTLVTDHKPLEIIYANPCSKPPVRIERWMLRLQQYDFEVVYKSGIGNPADYLSRHPTSAEYKKQNIADEYVNFVTQEAPRFHGSLTDTTLRCLRAAIRSNCWNGDILQPFRAIKHEISVDLTNNILLRGTRIIIPESLQRHVIKIAHEGHQGTAKTKPLLREYVWFPKLENFVNEEIADCLACQATGAPNAQEPLKSPPLPERPWQELKVDFYGPLPTGQYLFVVIDTYSRFPEVDIVPSTSASAIIPKLGAIFARHGMPDKLKSDNGPPFFGNEFHRYMKALGIRQTTYTLLWPQGNSEVESFMKPLGKSICTAILEKRQWQQELHKFLLNYRITPHTTTKVPPAQLLYNRPVKGKLPMLPRKHKNISRHREARENDQLRKENAMNYANKRRNTKECDIKVGDLVICMQKKTNKFSSRFNVQPYKVVRVYGSKVVARHGDHFISRNSSFFKKVQQRLDGNIANGRPRAWCIRFGL
ncbi:uncharacterized protein K02A2.6-like [Rhopilema esculentum]|uniref:uncharacterized protein K02A2.6-like n=1 Tax=Rhopilema esculentum TaxID=499914 RepID=UPI0031D59197